MSYLEVGRAVNSLIESQGLFSLWRGLSATILRDVPFSCIYWANYELMKKKLMKESEPTFAISFVCGAIAGAVAAVITLPFDVVKTHRQIELGEMQIIASNASNPSSTRDMLRKIYRQNGLKGLFSGIVPRVVKVAPACAIMISTYEFGKSFFRQYNASKQQK